MRSARKRRMPKKLGTLLLVLGLTISCSGLTPSEPTPFGSATTESAARVLKRGEDVGPTETLCIPPNICDKVQSGTLTIQSRYANGTVGTTVEFAAAAPEIFFARAHFNAPGLPGRFSETIAVLAVMGSNATVTMKYPSVVPTTNDLLVESETGPVVVVTGTSSLCPSSLLRTTTFVGKFARWGQTTLIERHCQ